MDILDEIRGVVVFAWLPVRMYDGSGFFREGFAWMRPVLKKHAIGFPKYFHTEIDDSPCWTLTDAGRAHLEGKK